jgi:CubicO group peptidase (beta-lactamase class C family)
MTATGWVAPGYERVRDVFARLIPQSGPGAAFAAVVDGVTVVDVWAGTADETGRPWQEQTACVIFSGTKGVVATAVLRLVERGALDLEAPVSSIWPAFAAAGKQAVRVRDLLAHTSGLPGVVAPITADDIKAPRRMSELLAAQAPIVPIGVACYHALTYGWLLDAIVRIVDGRSVGRLVADEVAGPLGLDLWIGLPERELGRVARISRSPDYELSAYAANEEPDPRLSFVYGPLAGVSFNDPAVLSAEIPAANGVTTARSLARLYGCLARGGELDGVRLLEPGTVARAATEQSRGDDPLSGRPLRFGAGFELAGTPSELGPAADAFGHTGAGGSTHGAWPSRATGFSFIVSEMRTEARDDRARLLLEALATALDKR